MNENFEDQKKDIKPERPEVSSNRGSRRTKGGGLLLSSTLTIINLIGLVVLFLWFFNTSGNQQMAGQNFIERISGLEDSFNLQTDVIEDLNQNLDSELRFVNKEVRKLWDLSNKRNRKNISENLNSIEDISVKLDELSKLNETLSAQQRALALELAKIAKIQEKANEALNNIDGLSSKTADSNLREIEESLESFNAYRIQVNKSLISLREQVNQLEISILDSTNE